MNMDNTYRKERIDRLLHELRYEITRGIMDGEIDESMSFQFIVPQSQLKDCFVIGDFRIRPIRKDIFLIDGPYP